MEIFSVPVEYSVDNIVSLNDQLAKARLRVAYTGANRNGSVIEKPAFEKAAATLPYQPVVAHYIKENDDFGGHDVDFEDDGETCKEIPLTNVIGVVPADTHCDFEIVTEESGVHNYFSIDVILWKRQKEFEVIQSKPFVKHSMEIEVLDGHRESDGFHISEFKFLAFCLLGDDVEPCFEGSKLTLFNCDAAQAQFTEFLATVKDYLNSDQPLPAGESNIDSERKEEKCEMDKKTIILNMGLNPDEIDIDFDAITDDEFSAKVFELTSNIQEQIRRALGDRTIETEWGTVREYWYCDSDFEKHEVYVWGYADDRLYGFTYAMEGDAVKIDFESRKPMKFAIVPFEGGEGEPSFLFVKELCKVVSDHADATYTAKMDEQKTAFEAEKEAIETEKNAVSEKLTVAEAQVEELTTYKKNVEYAATKAEKDALIAKWRTNLNGVEAFEALVAKADEYELADLEKEIKVIFADARANFTAKEAPKTRIPYNTIDSKTAEEYGGLYEKYGIKPTK